MTSERDKAYASALKFQQRGQLDRAILELERLVQTDPSDVRTLLKIGDLHSRRGDTQAAILAYTQVAQAYRDEGFALKAVAVYKQAIHLDAGNVAIARELAGLYEQLGLVSDAAAQHRALLRSAREAQRWDACIETLRRLMGLEGETQELLLVWADVHAHADDVPEAKRTLERVLEAMQPDGRTEAWARVAEQLLRVDPDLTGLACELARHYMARDEPKQALVKLQVAFRAAPQDTETLTLLAQVFEALDQVQKAVAVLHELAGQARQRGQQLSLERIAQHILRLDPSDAQAQALAAAPGAARSGRAEPEPHGRAEPASQAGAVRASAEQAAAPAAPDISHLLVEASVFRRYGLRRRALEYLDRILAAFPEHPDARAQHEAIAGELAAIQASARARDGAGSEPGRAEAHRRGSVHEATAQHMPGLDALMQDLLPSPERARAEADLDALMAPLPPSGAAAAPVEAGDFETQFNLGIAFREMGLIEDAIEQFSRTLAAPNYRINAQTMLGLCYLQQQRTPEALATFTAAIEAPEATQHQRLALHYELGVALEQTGDADAARSHFAAAQQIDPSFRDVAARLGA